MNKRVTINRINEAIKYLNFEIVKGDGYFYFISLNDDVVQLRESSVYVMQLSCFSVGEWKNRLQGFIDDAVKYQPECPTRYNKDGAIILSTKKAN